MTEPKRYLLIACAVLSRECYLCASRSKNLIDIRILEQGLHDIGEAKMSARLQEEIDAVDSGMYDAVLLAYGLCSNGIRGLHANVPLVVPRAHDCITLLMGSKEKYREYFDHNPGTYYRSVGWVERATSHLSNPDSTTTQMGMSTYREYVEKYGEENAAYLMETMGDWLRNYTKLAYINTHVGDFEDLKEGTRHDAEERGWNYEEIDGNTDLILRLMDGQWDDDDFLTVPPGEHIESDYDESIVTSAK